MKLIEYDKALEAKEELIKLEVALIKKLSFNLLVSKRKEWLFNDYSDLDKANEILLHELKLELDRNSKLDSLKVISKLNGLNGKLLDTIIFTYKHNLLENLDYVKESEVSLGGIRLNSKLDMI